jgi:hypothetical protein
MKYVLTAVLVTIFLSCGAHAQDAVCPNWSMGAKVHPVAETTYTVQVTDQCADLVFKNTGAEVVNLPNPGAFFPYGFMFRVQAVGAGGITLTPTSPVTVNASSTLAKAAGTAAMCYTDGVNWYC